jgi:iron complex outermembrane recepter protein
MRSPPEYLAVSDLEQGRRLTPALARANLHAEPQWLRSRAIVLSLFASLSLAAPLSGAAQTVAPAQDNPSALPPVVITKPERNRPQRGQAQNDRSGSGVRPARTPAARTAPAPRTSTSEAPQTPLNTNAVAASASRLGLTVHETPATVEIVDQRAMREQGYRTTTETAQGVAGVLAGDAPGAPGAFSMRGFTFSHVNVLYNGIWIGPQDITSRVADTSNLDRVEFLKGPSSLMSGLNAVGGSVNFVSREPATGPVKNELDTSIDSLGTYRTHFGSGGSTQIQGLDYRVDIGQSRINSFIDGADQDLTNFSGQLNYRLSESFKAFVALEAKRDEGHAYWGTPLVPASFSGAFAQNGVVSGKAVSTFDGSTLGSVTVDSRTLTTNYNIANNSVGAQQLWLRGGFEWAVSNNVTVKDQAYDYSAKRHWFDSETYAFNLGTSTIDRDRFFVTHNQHVTGNNTDLVWDSALFGMENRLAAQLQVSRNDIRFAQEGNPNAYPADTVSVFNPDPGLYGVPEPNIRNSHLTTLTGGIEDRLKLSPMLALIGGIRFDDFTLERDGINFDGTIPSGQPFTKTWTPVSYRAALTFEPIRGLNFYSMYATAYDPAAAGIFSVTPRTSLELTSSRIYETGVKHLFWDNKAEWALAAYDLSRRNVYVQINETTSTLAGEIHTKGIEVSGAVRPIEDVKLWANAGVADAHYVNFNFEGSSWSGNTPSNVAPLIVNAGASYRFSHWRWPVEAGASVRHVASRYLFEDDATTMRGYTTGDIYAFVDIPHELLWQGLDQMRVTFRVRNVTNAVYAAWSDPGYPDQVLLGAPRTFELSASVKW